MKWVNLKRWCDRNDNWSVATVIGIYYEIVSSIRHAATDTYKVEGEMTDMICLAFVWMLVFAVGAGLAAELGSWLVSSVWETWPTIAGMILAAIITGFVFQVGLVKAFRAIPRN